MVFCFLPIRMVVVLVALLVFGAAVGVAFENGREFWQPSGARVVQPLFNEPLRDTAITRGKDGIYYLTGTSGSKRPDGSVDFARNDGIWLWQSKDLKKWEPLGQVWSLSRDPLKAGNPFHGNPSGWQLAWRSSTSRVPSRGLHSPELHWIKGGCYLTYSIQGRGTGLLKSRTGAPKGPYVDLGCISASGQEASLFEDEDGAVYWVWGEGWIARMKEDLTGLAEEPRLLRVTPEVEGGTWPLTIGAGGAFLFRATVPEFKDGAYHLIGYDRVPRMGAVECVDTFIASAPSVYGPYSKRNRLIQHGGQSTVFPRPDGGYAATFSGTDEWAAVREMPAMVPLAAHPTVRGEDYWWAGAFTKPWYPVTEAGAWSTMNPLVNQTELRDIAVLNAPDGYYYLTFTDMDLRLEPHHNKTPKTPPKREEYGFQVYRSKDLKNWEDMGLVWRCDDALETREALSGLLASGGWRAVLFDPEMHYLKGTYWLVASMRVKKEWYEKDGCRILVLKSTSGKPEGPYVQVWKGPHTADLWTPSLFEDDDGSVYIVGGGIGNRVGKLKPDFSGLDGKLWEIIPENLHVVGEGGHLLKIGSHYVHTSAVWHGFDPYLAAHGKRARLFSTYDLMYSTATNLKGPWSVTRCAAPKCGNSRPFQDKEGNWFATFFGNHFSGPWHEMPGLYPLKVDYEQGQLILSPAR